MSDADETDRHRHAGAIDQAAEQVAAEMVGAQQIHDVGLAQWTDEVNVRREDAPQLVGGAMHEQPDRHDLARVDDESAAQRDLVDLDLVARHVRLELQPAVGVPDEEGDGLRRRIRVDRVRGVRQAGRQEFAEGSDQVKDEHDRTGGHRHLLADKLLPDQGPLAGGGIADRLAVALEWADGGAGFLGLVDRRDLADAHGGRLR